MPKLSADDVHDLEATALPVAFDVVWCHFPYRQHGLGPGPVARPCLVRQSFTHLTMIAGKPHRVGYIDVVYGTKQVDRFDPTRGFHVGDEDEKRRCGLAVDTVFDLCDHQVLPWSPRYFPATRGRLLVAGHFSEAMQQRLHDQISQLKP